MRLSLRMRVLLLLVGINTAVAGFTFWFVLNKTIEDSEKATLELALQFVENVTDHINRGRGLNVAPILAWPKLWSRFADGILLDANLDVGPDGAVSPRGVQINPVGRAQRAATLDEGAVYRAIHRAIETGVPVDGVEGGRAIPIQVDDFNWGGYWYRVEDPPYRRELLVYFLPIFLLSTGLLSIGTFFAIRRFVLDPVEELVQGARNVEAGDLAVRLAEPRASDEIAELIRGFNAMTARVESFHKNMEHEVQQAIEKARRAEAAAMTQRRLAAMGELAAGIAHEINNPLGGLLNAVETLSQDKADEAKRKRYYEILHGGLERIRLTVGKLLNLTPRQSARQTFALVTPLDDALALVRHRIRQQGVTVRYYCDGESLPHEEWRAAAEALPPLEGQVHELGQVALNLLGNSLDALEEKGAGGTIELRLAQLDGELELEVADDGPGVDDATLERVSDLFYTTKDPGKGTGLGLGLVHQLVHGNGGEIEFRSAPGRGFSARLRLPVPDASPRRSPGRADTGGARGGDLA